MRPIWKPTDFSATTRATTSGGDRSMGRARPAGEAKARQDPKARTIRKMGMTEVGSERTYNQSRVEVATSPDRANPYTTRLSNRSAVAPANGASRAMGRNSARPSRPRCNSLPVMSYTCLPSTVT